MNFNFPQHNSYDPPPPPPPYEDTPPAYPDDGTAPPPPPDEGVELGQVHLEGKPQIQPKTVNIDFLVADCARDMKNIAEVKTQKKIFAAAMLIPIVGTIVGGILYAIKAEQKYNLLTQVAEKSVILAKLIDSPPEGMTQEQVKELSVNKEQLDKILYDALGGEKLGTRFYNRSIEGIKQEAQSRLDQHAQTYSPNNQSEMVRPGTGYSSTLNSPWMKLYVYVDVPVGRSHHGGFAHQSALGHHNLHHGTSGDVSSGHSGNALQAGIDSSGKVKDAASGALDKSSGDSKSIKSDSIKSDSIKINSIDNRSSGEAASGVVKVTSATFGSKI